MLHFYRGDVLIPHLSRFFTHREDESVQKLNHCPISVASIHVQLERRVGGEIPILSM